MRAFYLFFPAIFFVYTFAAAQTAKRFEVVIHEFMADPSPQVGLPSSEFIELRNVSSVPFSLRNWKIGDGSSTATINTGFILRPDSIVILCPVAALPAFSAFGTAVGITGFPSLNNDADLIVLLSPEGMVIHAIAYDVSWYANGVKSQGGWTLEMADARNPCEGAGNWYASRNVKGGTPGERNSVEAINADQQAPALIRTYTIDSTTIVAVFDEPLDSLSAAITANYRLDNGRLVSRAEPAGPFFKEIKLAVSPALLPGTIYTLTVAGITDCAGNNIVSLNSARAGVPTTAVAEEIVLNEVLFNPSSTGTDYIELYNRSGSVLDAAALFIAGRNNNGHINTPGKLSEQPFLIFPGDFILITADAAAVQSQHAVRYPRNILTPSQMPSLPDDKGIIVLLNTRGIVIDELPYDEKWHFPLIANREGVALERIDARLPTCLKDNWTSAAADAGYGTPTYRNSQSKSLQFTTGKIEIVPRVFSPDNDGLDDLCFIHYQFTTPNKVATVTIFDVYGYPVRKLFQPATLSEKGFFRWDGLDDKGNKSATGVYIILVTVFDLQGHVTNFRNTVTLAHRF